MKYMCMDKALSSYAYMAVTATTLRVEVNTLLWLTRVPCNIAGLISCVCICRALMSSLRHPMNCPSMCKMLGPCHGPHVHVDGRYVCSINVLFRLEAAFQCATWGIASSLRLRLRLPFVSDVSWLHLVVGVRGRAVRASASISS